VRGTCDEAVADATAFATGGRRDGEDGIGAPIVERPAGKDNAAEEAPPSIVVRSPPGFCEENSE
jgi:hypothetical protein